jgi:hypothetical protein
MTRLIDVHTPQCDVSESLVLHIDAAPAHVLAVVDTLDAARRPIAGAEMLGHARDERLFGMTWLPEPGAAGHVDVVWDIRVESDGDDGTYLSSTRCFTAGDDAARNRLLSRWRAVRTTADAVARRTARAIKRVAEEEREAAPASTWLRALRAA